uniref:Uncharacterized protein n=1 Tax=Takifugu rubripes TaxID=31033 RepID=A0A674NF79_TAKRU
ILQPSLVFGELLERDMCAIILGLWLSDTALRERFFTQGMPPWNTNMGLQISNFITDLKQQCLFLHVCAFSFNH